jgi:Flp pilus assembly protein TadD
LFEADMPHLQNSAKANYMTAKEIRRIYRTNKDLTKEEYDIQSAKAIHYYNQAIEAYPGYALAIEELGMIYAIEQKNRSMAIPLFEKAFALDSTLWRSANNLAMALQISADTAGAIKWYEKALKAKADNPKVLVELGKLYYLNGEKAKALATNDTLQKLIPDSYLPYYNYGVYYMLERDTLKAVHYFEEDIKRGERERFPYLFLIKHYLSKHDTANAIRVRKFAPRVSQ